MQELYSNPLSSNAGEIQACIEGNLITCNYNLEINPMYETCGNCYVNPKVIMPLYVINLPHPSWNSYKLPNDWNPIIMNVTNILINPGQIQPSYYKPQSSALRDISLPVNKMEEMNPFSTQENEPLDPSSKAKSGQKKINIEMKSSK